MALFLGSGLAPQFLTILKHRESALHSPIRIRWTVAVKVSIGRITRAAKKARRSGKLTRPKKQE